MKKSHILRAGCACLTLVAGCKSADTRSASKKVADASAIAKKSDTASGDTTQTAALRPPQGDLSASRAVFEEFAADPNSAAPKAVPAVFGDTSGRSSLPRLFAPAAKQC